MLFVMKNCVNTLLKFLKPIEPDTTPVLNSIPNLACKATQREHAQPFFTGDRKTCSSPKTFLRTKAHKWEANCIELLIVIIVYENRLFVLLVLVRVNW